MQVAVFRGGFRPQAAQAVAGVSAPTLRALAHKSLLVWDEAQGRYALHNDIRYYALEQLETQPSLAQQVRTRHAVFFADFLQQREGALHRPQQAPVLAEIEPDLPNLLAAWEWALAQRDTALLARLMHGLFAFYESKAWFDEEHAFLLLQRARVAFLQAQYAQARTWAEAGLARYRALGQPAGSGDGLALLGWTAYELGDYAAAEALCREAQAVCAQTGYVWGVQYAVYGLGLAVAQMIHETGNLTSFWAARPRRNPAGIGVTGQKQATPSPDTNGWAFNPQRQQWEAGVSFATWEYDAIPAHVGRLLAYALPIGAENPVQRAAIERALRYRALPARMRGSVPILKQLGRVHNPTGQGWASPGTDYGAKIAAIAARIVTGR